MVDAAGSLNTLHSDFHDVVFVIERSTFGMADASVPPKADPTVKLKDRPSIHTIHTNIYMLKPIHIGSQTCCCALLKDIQALLEGVP